MTEQNRPPMDPNTSEATRRQLDLALEQGEAYGRALAYMTGEVAHDGGEQEAGHYSIGYAIEEAEGMYEWFEGELVWRNPQDENVHVEVSVRDAADGRFVPGVRVLPRSWTPKATRLAPTSNHCCGIP